MCVMEMSIGNFLEKQKTFRKFGAACEQGKQRSSTLDTTMAGPGEKFLNLKSSDAWKALFWNHLLYIKHKKLGAIFKLDRACFDERAVTQNFRCIRHSLVRSLYSRDKVGPEEKFQIRGLQLPGKCYFGTSL